MEDYSDKTESIPGRNNREYIFFRSEPFGVSPLGLSWQSVGTLSPFPPISMLLSPRMSDMAVGYGRKIWPPMSPPTLKWGERGIPPLRIRVSNARITNERMLANTDDSKLHP